MANGCIHSPQESVGVESHPEHHDQNGHKTNDLTQAEIGETLDFFVGDGALHHALEHPEQVAGRQDDRGHTEYRQKLVGLECAEQAEYLPDKPVEAR